MQTHVLLMSKNKEKGSGKKIKTKQKKTHKTESGRGTDDVVFMDIVDDGGGGDDDDQLYPAICSILPVQYSRRQLYYCNKN